MASFIHNEGANQLTAGSINWATDTIKARLVSSAVTPDKDDANMSTYTGLGADVTLSGKTKTKDLTNDRIVYDAADPTFLAVPSGATAAVMVVFKAGADDASSIPICCSDITDTPTNGGDIAITFNAAGIFYLQQ
jgi:hypothetical protein